MDQTLYLECNSGISGDMTVGALLDLGADREKLEKVISSMELEGYELCFGRTKKCGIDAYDFDVRLENQGHVHLHFCQHEHEHSHEHQHQHDHEHHHEHRHEHNHEHSHEHRNIREIYEIIDKSEASIRAKSLAKKIFDIVADAESKAHGVPVEEVHFHEVGAVDSIIDIVGTAVCIDDLDIEKVIVSPLSEGRGFVWCQHGIMPVPVPATLNIAAAHGLVLDITGNKGEMVTPTGAAIAAALKSGSRLPEHFCVKKTGIGAGNKDFDNANILRAMIIEEQACCSEKKDSGCMWKLETNLDDCTGEAMGFTMEKLLESGAADVWYTPIYMKKNRPAYMLSVLCREEDIEDMEDIIFSNTTTIGIRRCKAERTVLDRKNEEIEVGLCGKRIAKVKVCEHKNEKYVYPEYESVKALAEDSGTDFKQAEAVVLAAVYKEKENF